MRYSSWSAWSSERVGCRSSGLRNTGQLAIGQTYFAVRFFDEARSVQPLLRPPPAFSESSKRPSSRAAPGRAGVQVRSERLEVWRSADTARKRGLSSFHFLQVPRSNHANYRRADFS